MRWLVPLVIFATACGGSGKPYDDSLRATKKADDGAVLRAVDAWGFQSCTDGARCVDRLAASAGVARLDASTPNPRATLMNPDAAWLPGWEALPAANGRARDTYAALALMAHDRSYARVCDAAYVRTKKELDDRLERAEKAVATTRTQPNAYDRIAALLALRPGSDPAKPTRWTEGSDAARLTIELGIFEGFEATNRTFLYLVGGFAPRESLAAALSVRDTKVERDLFCLDAMEGKIAGVPPYPAPPPELMQVRGVVSEVVPAPRAAIAKKRRAEIAEVAQKQLAKAMAKNVGLPPSVRVMGNGRVDRFERDGQGATVRLLTVTESVDGGKQTKIDETITASFADWPPNLVLVPGDTISFYGVEDKLKETLIKSTPTLEHKSRVVSATGKHLVRVTNQGKTTSFVDAPR